MTFQRLPLTKGRDAAGHNISSWAKHETNLTPRVSPYLRHVSTTNKESRKEKIEPQVGRGIANGKGTKTDQFSNRDFFLSILDSSATKREARAYLQRFTPPKERPSPKKEETRADGEPASVSQHHGVNLGTFYGTRAVHDSPKFMQKSARVVDTTQQGNSLHVALVKLRAPQDLDEETLSGVALTLSQLGKLGMTSVVVVDCASHANRMAVSQESDLRALADEQVNRVVVAIEKHGEPGARQLDNIIGVSDKSDSAVLSTPDLQRTHIRYRKLLMTPLRRGVIPVIGVTGYTDENRAVPVKADDVVLALTWELAGFQADPVPNEDPSAVPKEVRSLRSEVSVDRLIVLDPLGGIPHAERSDRYHVFLNLKQEFGPVKQSLFNTQSNRDIPKETNESPASKVSDVARGNPFSSFAESEIGFPMVTKSPTKSSNNVDDISPNNKFHLQNLELVRGVLSLLPPTSSALLTTPMEAANSGKDVVISQAIGVGTRRRRNPLIHNLLTDKPVYSSSLPHGRLGQVAPSGTEPKPTIAFSSTTFAKRGVSVTIFPDPRINPWKPCLPGQTLLTLTDSQIDLPRLVHLINDSFDRKLDVEKYLARVNHRIAGVIIAGEYEGGALLTWETPPGVPDDGSEESRARMVPYLDKFAVLKSSQGAGGVADILFKAMVKDCFPGGVCWRSRRDNPVNKWYFERSRGTWKLPHTNWTMFWTTPNLDMDRRRFSDYEGVSRNIVPSWADDKAVLD